MSVQSLDNGFLVGGHTVLPKQGTILLGDEIIHLEPKVMDVLVCLARRAGDVVSRQDFLDEVWGDVVVQDEVLNRSISILRSHFGDRPGEPQFIQTVPRRGYRLVVEVTPIEEKASPAQPWLKASGVVLVGIGALTAAYFFLDQPTGPAATWAPRGPVVTMAVLDFADRTPGSGSFSAGLTDQIMSDLSRVEGLRVMHRTADRAQDVCQQGESLDTETLLTGGVLQVGDRLRVSFQWINNSDCYQILADTYNRTVDDVFEVQQSISRGIVTRLTSALGTKA